MRCQARRIVKDVVKCGQSGFMKEKILKRMDEKAIMINGVCMVF